MRTTNHPIQVIGGTIALVGMLAGSGCQDPFDDGLTGAVITVVDSGPPLRNAVTFALPDAGLLRHPRFIGLRNDKAAQEVRRED